MNKFALRYYTVFEGPTSGLCCAEGKYTPKVQAFPQEDPVAISDFSYIMSAIIAMQNRFLLSTMKYSFGIWKKHLKFLISFGGTHNRKCKTFLLLKKLGFIFSLRHFK